MENLNNTTKQENKRPEESKEDLLAKALQRIEALEKQLNERPQQNTTIALDQGRYIEEPILQASRIEEEEFDLDKQQQTFMKERNKEREEYKKRKIMGNRHERLLKYGNNKLLAEENGFLRSCDNNPKVKEYLSFYYDALKECRYDKIATFTVEKQGNYEQLCKHTLRMKNFDFESMGRPDFYYEFLPYAFKGLE